jgi:glutamate-1-semialdehyde 2,1-aminomutase
MSRSEEYFARARSVTPGGVHSPVRAFRAVGGTALFMESASGATIRDVDGNSYIDYCMSFGPLIHGHSDPEVTEAVHAAIDRGTSLGTAEQYSLELAELITDSIAWVDSIRFVNSGTEAVMTAIRLARAATRRTKILKFDGCYHGHTDPMLIRAGSGLAGPGQTDSAGVPEGVAADTLVAQLDDLPGLEQLFDRHGDEIAAAIIEPLPANHGLLPQTGAFLQTLADQLQRHDALLIFDEVITGFRLAFGGFAETSAMRPDLVTYGKVIGGGFPVGALGGRRELMDLLAPDGPVYQAGTLSANPVAMVAGLIALRKLRDGSAYRELDERASRLANGLADVDDLLVQQQGSLFWLGLGQADTPDGIVRSPAAIPETAAKRFGGFFHHMLGNGIYLPPSPFEVGFLSTAHTDQHLDELAVAVRQFPAIQ